MTHTEKLTAAGLLVKRAAEEGFTSWLKHLFGGQKPDGPQPLSAQAEQYLADRKRSWNPKLWSTFPDPAADKIRNPMFDATASAALFGGVPAISMAGILKAQGGTGGMFRKLHMLVPALFGAGSGAFSYMERDKENRMLESVMRSTGKASPTIQDLLENEAYKFNKLNKTLASSQQK